MKFIQIILLIAITLTIFYLVKPLEFKQYITTPITNFINPILKTQNQTINQTNQSQTATIVPGVLGKPNNPYNCITNADCQRSYPKYSTIVTCNNGSGECEVPAGTI